MLTIEPYGGLCNRLRSLDSAISLAVKIDRPIHLIWKRNKELNCNFSSLFLLPDQVKKLSQPYMPILLRRIFKKINLLRFKYQITLYQHDIENLIDQNFNFENLKKYDSIYIATPGKFFDNPHRFSQFKPLPKINSVVDEITKDFNSETIGVHVRRTDNLKSKSVSKIRKFIEQMQTEVILNAKTKFFLATDDALTENIFIRKFHKKIIVYPKRALKRNKPIAIEDALIDLLCLSKTSRILGSYWSSFTDTAAQINNIELSIIQ